MTLRDQSGREIEVNEVDGEIGEGAHVACANYVDDGSEVPEQILEWLTDAYQGEIYDSFYQDMVCRAEDAYDRATDR